MLNPVYIFASYGVGRIPHAVVFDNCRLLASPGRRCRRRLFAFEGSAGDPPADRRQRLSSAARPRRHLLLLPGVFSRQCPAASETKYLLKNLRTLREIM